MVQFILAITFLFYFNYIVHVYVPVIKSQAKFLLYLIQVAKLCKGEYPNDIKIYILNTDDEIINTTSISPQVDNQLMIRGEVPIPNNLSTFIINISLSNYGGNFNNISSFVFGKSYFTILHIILVCHLIF